MKINDELRKRNMTMYRLSRVSGVPQATVSDICSGKASLQRCSAGTVYRIAKALCVTVEDLLESEKTAEQEEYRPSFDTFRGNVCHRLKRMGDLDFIIDTLERNEIAEFCEKKRYPEAFYLLAMVDYLSRLHDLPLCTNYEELRGQKLSGPVYPAGVRTLAAICGDDTVKEKAREEAIPEFIRFNIVEGDIRDVV